VRRPALLLAAAALTWIAAATPAVAQEPPAELAAAAADLEAGRLEAAEGRLRARLAAGDDPLTHDLLGVTLSRMGRHDDAERHFRRAIEGGLAEARGHLARLYLLQGREAEAVDELRRAAEAGPEALERDLALKLAVAELSAGRG
jgi:Flp pilus assembly protein TadD